MTPYYKLAKNWATQSQHFLIIGPEGLVSNQLFNQIKQTYKKYSPKLISLLDQEDIEQFKNQSLTSSLFPEPEILFVRISDKLLNKFPWKIPVSTERVICIYGIEKPPKDTKKLQEFGTLIRTYSMKEPFRSREIAALLSQKKLTLSQKGIKWIAMSHHGVESLIPSTINKILLTFGPSSVSDQDLRACLHNQSNVSTFDVIDTLTESSSKLHLFARSQKKENWIPLYWALVSHWRKILLTAKDPATLKAQFPWDSQHRAVKAIIHSMSVADITTGHQTLLNIEPHTKGLGNENATLLIQLWLYQTQAKILA